MSLFDPSLYEKLIEYSKSDYYPLHMPGHKRRGPIFFEDPYTYDITEIDGFDDLHHPEGILKEAMETAAKLYHVDRSYFLVNGSTCGILTALSALTELGDTVIVAANSHKSVWNTIYMRNLFPILLSPEDTGCMGINGGITPDSVEQKIIETEKSGRKPKAVMIVSPTYEGVVSDVRGIAEVCHTHGIPLIVDEAHGAHLPFRASSYLPKSAVSCGADLVIQSLHKTLPALTQTAILHVNLNRRVDVSSTEESADSYYVDLGSVERFLGIYQSSSPSYVLMASIDSCIRMMATERFGMELYEEQLQRFWKKAEKLSMIRFLDPKEGEAGIYAFDPGKIVFGVRDEGISGKELQSVLREKYHMELEMATAQYALAMTSLYDSDSAIDKFFLALEEIDRELLSDRKNCQKTDCENKKTQNERQLAVLQLKERHQCLSPYEASVMKTEYVSFEDAINHISAEMAYIYPPGIPFFLPGERITREMYQLLVDNTDNNLRIRGLSRENQILVVKEEEG